MTYVVTATWRAREGEEERIAQILETITPLCRAEPGCLMYQAHRSPDDARLFFIYEQYDDEAAFEAHARTEHVERHVRGDAVPRLELRERAIYETLA
jgi:quinol monooxygenase YgiN